MGTSENNDDMVPLNSLPEEKRKTIGLGPFKVNLILANVFFAFLAVGGEVGQNVTLPLWVDSSIPPPSGHLVHSSFNHTNDTGHLMRNGYSANHINSSSGSGDVYQPRVDAFFVYTFASMAFVMLFGGALLFIRLFQPHLLGQTERRFPHSQLFLVGLFDALNGTLVVYASSGRRTAPYLQAILGNFMIPLIMAFR